MYMSPIICLYVIYLIPFPWLFIEIEAYFHLLVRQLKKKNTCLVVEVVCATGSDESQRRNPAASLSTLLYTLMAPAQPRTLRAQYPSSAAYYNTKFVHRRTGQRLTTLPMPGLDVARAQHSDIPIRNRDNRRASPEQSQENTHFNNVTSSPQAKGVRRLSSSSSWFSTDSSLTSWLCRGALCADFHVLLFVDYVFFVCVVYSFSFL